MLKMEVYEPVEDSEFFAEFLRKYLSKSKKNLKYLDVGTGSGILALVGLEVLPKENVFACDINEEAVKRASKKGIPAFSSNLFSNVSGKFDLITFNAPYLPRDSREPEDSQVATTGGERGDEISLRFLKDAKKHLNSNGKILLLISSLTPMNRIEKFGGKVVARLKIFLEELIILEFQKNH